MFLFCPGKGAEVPDLNALKLCETRGFSVPFHIKPMFLGPNKNIFGRFGGLLDTMNKPSQSGQLRMRLNVDTKVLNQGDDVMPGRWINSFRTRS
jgi:hypothetical protein